MPHVMSSKKILDISRASDPKEGILKAIGPLEGQMRQTGSWVLLGTYIQPERRKSGLYLAHDTLKEDEYQGVVGLILQMGPDAQEMSEAQGKIGLKVGDWVTYSIRTSYPESIKGCPCRRIQYELIRSWIVSPDAYY